MGNILDFTVSSKALNSMDYECFKNLELISNSMTTSSTTVAGTNRSATVTVSKSSKATKFLIACYFSLRIKEI